jgi:multidrug efflux pump subunit AcrA (membrane-fusion protein)
VVREHDLRPGQRLCGQVVCRYRRSRQERAVLATIDTPELDAELLAAKAKLQVSQAQVKVKQADAAFAASTYARWRDSPKGVVSEQEREDKKAGDAQQAAQLEAARAQVNSDQADVDRLTAFEQFKRVTAPYAGTIIERRIDIGNLVTAGSSATAPPRCTAWCRMTRFEYSSTCLKVPRPI